jgi:phage-related protein
MGLMSVDGLSIDLDEVSVNKVHFDAGYSQVCQAGISIRDADYSAVTIQIQTRISSKSGLRRNDY